MMTEMATKVSAYELRRITELDDSKAQKAQKVENFMKKII